MKIILKIYNNNPFCLPQTHKDFEILFDMPFLVLENLS